MEKQELKQNISNCSQWSRLLYMLLFGAVLYLVMVVLCIVVIVQAAYALVKGSTNENIQEFSKDLSRYITQIVFFLTYNENRKPYPFNPLDNVRTEDEKDEKDEHETIIDVEACDDNAEDDDKSKPTV